VFVNLSCTSTITDEAADMFVDWLIDAGNNIHRIDDYDEWLTRLQAALAGLPERQRQHSVLPLLHRFAEAEQPVRGAGAPTEGSCR
jgi:fatty acid CoA ligase FadD9